MNTRNIMSFIKKSGITTGVGALYGAIGCVEGAISGAAGAAILGHNVKESAFVGAMGGGILGTTEGLILGALAVNGIFGSYEEIERRCFQTWQDHAVAYIAYTGNQVLGVLTAGLILKVFNSSIKFTQKIADDVAVGGSITASAITPAVTICTALILSGAYHATKEKEKMDEPSNTTINRKI